jgi:hypothetical protein
LTNPTAFQLETYSNSEDDLTRHLRSPVYKKLLLLMEMGAEPPTIEFHEKCWIPLPSDFCSDLSVRSQEDLDKVALLLNQHPRQTFGFSNSGRSTASKCCTDLLRPPVFAEYGKCEIPS